MAFSEGAGSRFGLFWQKIIQHPAALGAGAIGSGAPMPTNTIANRVGASVSTDQAVIRPKKKRKFGVSDNVLRRSSKVKA